MAAPQSSVGLLPWQERYLGIPHSYNVFLGGGRGGGKTEAAALAVLQFVAMYRDRGRVLVGRPDTYKGSSDLELKIDDLLRQAYPRAVSHNRQDHVIRVGGGGHVEFTGITKDTAEKFQGREFGLLVADEAGNFKTLKHVDMLRSNLRSARGIPVRAIYIANPGGAAHTALMRRYITGRVPWRSFADDFEERWIYIPTTFRDNIYLDPRDYERKLKAAAGGDSALAEAWSTGSWGKVRGAFFAHVLDERQVIPDDGWTVPATGWESGVGLDWGQSRPSVALLYAKPMAPGLPGPGGRTYPVGSKLVIDEVHSASSDDPNVGLDWPPQMLAESVIERCRARGVRPWGVGDDARGLDRSTLLSQLREHGLHLRKPRKDRISGWVRVKAMLSEAAKPDPEEPGIWISERCRYLHETLPILQRNKLIVEDLDSKGPDHGADALRYLAMDELPMAPEIYGGELITPAR